MNARSFDEMGSKEMGETSVSWSAFIMLAVMKGFTSETFIYGCILLATIGTVLDNLWYGSPTSFCQTIRTDQGTETVCEELPFAGGWSPVRVFLIPLIVIDVILFLNTLYFFHHIYNAYQHFHQNFKDKLIRRNQNPINGRTTNQVPLLSPFLRLIGLYVDTIVMMVTGLIISCLVGLCILGLLALAVGFFLLISFIPRTGAFVEI